MIFVVVIDVYIVVCGFAHMELLRCVDLQTGCVWSFASVTILRFDTVSLVL